MRFLHTTLFSLAASAAVLPVEISNTQKHTLVEHQKRDNVTNSIFTSAMLQLVEYALKDKLPSAIQMVTSNMYWMMQWTEKPVKSQLLQPEVKMRGLIETTKRTKFSYGPYEIRGAKVCRFTTIDYNEPYH
jgi:hypothetical protein